MSVGYLDTDTTESRYLHSSSSLTVISFDNRQSESAFVKKTNHERTLKRAAGGITSVALSERLNSRHLSTRHLRACNLRSSLEKS